MNATLSPWQSPPSRVSVAIIGGGIAGCSIAYWLSRAGIDCAVLERAGVAAGASGRNDGQVLLESAEFYNRLVAGMGRERAREILNFRRDCIRELAAFASPLEKSLDLRRGCVALASTPAEEKELSVEFSHLSDDGFNVQWQDRDAAAAKSGSDAFTCGLFFPDDLTLDPFRLTESIAAAARLGGARVCEGVEVTAVHEDKISYRQAGVDGELRFDMLVFATNAYAAQLLPGYAKRLWPVRAQMLMSEPTDPPLSLPHGCQTNYGYDYWKERGGRIYIGGRRFLDESAEYTDQEGLNDKIQNAIVAFVEETYGRKIRVARRWSGIMCYSQDGLPLIGALPGFGDRFISAGFTGYGLSYAFLAGKLLARVIENSDPAAAARLAAFQPRRFV